MSEKNNNYEGQAKTLSSLGNIYFSKNGIIIMVMLWKKFYINT